jgi:plasmid stabilization system protein ParE
MTRRVIVRREAKRDLGEAKTWYRNISRQLANDFIRRIDEAIDLAQERPLAFPLVHQTFRRILVHRFPYALFYHADETRIVVVAVLHQARDPETLESRQA